MEGKKGYLKIDKEMNRIAPGSTAFESHLNIVVRIDGDKVTIFIAVFETYSFAGLEVTNDTNLAFHFIHQFSKLDLVRSFDGISVVAIIEFDSDSARG